MVLPTTNPPQRADGCTSRCADGGLGKLLLAGIGIGGAGGGQQGNGAQRDKRSFHGSSPFSPREIEPACGGNKVKKGLFCGLRRFRCKETTGLTLPQTGVEAAFLEQAAVAAFLDDAAPVHDHQAVHGGDG